MFQLPDIAISSLQSTDGNESAKIESLVKQLNEWKREIEKGLLVGLKAGGVDIKDGKIATPNSVIPSNLGIDWVWQAWEPEFTNLSGGTLDYALYIQTGKTIFFKLKYTLLDAGVAGAVSFTPPVAMSETMSSTDEPILSTVYLNDTTTNQFVGCLRWASPTTVEIRSINAASTTALTAALSAGSPFTWTSTDVIAISGSYEAA